MRPNVEYAESNLDAVASHPLSPLAPFEAAPARTVSEFVGVAPTPSELDETFMDPSMIMPFIEPSIQLTTMNGAVGPSQMQTFLPRMTGLQQPTMHKTEQYQLTPGEFRDGLVRVSSILDISADWHSVRHLNDWHGGMGMESFLNRLQTLVDPQNDPKEWFDTSNPVVYIARFGVDEYLVIELMISRATEGIESCTVGVLTGDRSVDERFYRSLVANFGAGDLQQRSVEVESFTIEPEVPTSLTVKDRLVLRREDDAEQFVTGLAVEHPLQDEPFRREAIDQVAARTGTTPEEVSLSQELASYDLAYTRLTEPHSRRETHDYQIEQIRVQRLDSVVEWDSVWNIDIITAR